jgi:hypothetical protein
MATAKTALMTSPCNFVAGEALTVASGEADVEASAEPDMTADGEADTAACCDFAAAGISSPSQSARAMVALSQISPKRTSLFFTSFHVMGHCSLISASPELRAAHQDDATLV